MISLIAILQLHYLSPAKHLFKSQLRVLENLVNSLETENRCRAKRGQHPLTYYEAYALLTQLVGGDVLNACQSANINSDVYTSANLEEGCIVMNRMEVTKMVVTIKATNEAKGDEENLPVEEANLLAGTTSSSIRMIQSGYTAGTLILPVAVQLQIVLKNIAAVRDLLVALFATRKRMEDPNMTLNTEQFSVLRLVARPVVVSVSYSTTVNCSILILI